LIGNWRLTEVLLADLAEVWAEPDDFAERVGLAQIIRLEHDPEKLKPVFPRDKREVRLREDHAQTKG
jgi:hypothetical protein